MLKIQKSGISIILPAFNEEKNIRQMVRDCLKYLQKQNYNYEIIVVNDGSSDQTELIAQKIVSQNKKVHLINHSQNLGYAQALKNGFNTAKHKYVFFTDSDRQFRLDALDIMFPIIQIKKVDLVVGYRLHRQDSALRKFLSWGYNALATVLFDLTVKDIDCAFKLFRKDIFKKIEIESTNWFFNTEILAKARLFNYNIIEVGVPHFPRTAGKSTVKFKHVPLTIKELLRIRTSINYLKNKKNQK